MGERHAAKAAAGLWCTAVAVALIGCAPDPTPTPLPTATGFASEAEAFAAAEATYRAYVDALNKIDLADSATFGPVYDLLAGEALGDEVAALQDMHENKWVVSGDSIVTDFLHVPGESRLFAIGCLDVSEVELVDAQGESQVSEDRPDVYAMKLKFASSRNATGLRITWSAAVEDPRCST